MSELLVSQLQRYFDHQKDWVWNTLKAYVECESPTSDALRVDDLAALIEADAEKIGGRIFRLEQKPRPVCVRFSEEPARLALIYHHDTVWPVGSFLREGIERGCWYGPGIYDMKAGIPLGLLALRFFRENMPDVLEKIMLVSSPDEEVMGDVSCRCLPGLVKGCEWGLVFEPPTQDGAFKHKRKGLGRLEVSFHGKASHSGNHYAEGRSALRAAAHFLLKAEALTNLERGFSVNVGLLQGGSALNTRPAHASLGVDVRIVNDEQWCAFLQFLESYVDPDGVALKWKITTELPPLHADHRDWRKLEEVCGLLGKPFCLGSAGGGSDGNLLAKEGLKIFDGLGVLGGGEHAEHEHIRVEELGPTFVRTVLLIVALLSDR